MVIYIKRILLFLCFFFLFDTLEIDSNYNKHLFYNKKDIYLEDKFTIYFSDIHSNELESILESLDICVKSYIVDNDKYYVHDIDELINEYTEDKTLKDKIYYENNGVNIDGIEVVCQVNELIKLENLVNIF